MSITRRDKMLSDYNGNLKSAIVHDASGQPVAITNGVLVTVEKGLMTREHNGRELVKATLATEADKDKELYLVHNPEVMYDEKLLRDDFVIAKGMPARLFSLATGDIFTNTVDLFDGTPTVGSVLTVKTNGKLGADGADAKIKFVVIEDSGFQLHRSKKAFAVEVER